MHYLRFARGLISQWIRDTSHLLDQTVQTVLCSDYDEDGEFLDLTGLEDAERTLPINNRIDRWGFSDDAILSSCIFDHCPTAYHIYKAIKERQQEIQAITQSYHSKIDQAKNSDPFYQKLSAVAAEEDAQGIYHIPSDRLKRCQNGIGGAYFALDAQGTPRFVIKPIDEDVQCINNHSNMNSFLNQVIGLRPIPLYRSAVREVAAFELAKKLGIEEIVPHTSLAVIQSDAFHDLSLGVAPEEKEFYERTISTPLIREKLCSIQEFIPESQTIQTLLQNQGRAQLNIDDFEKAMLLIWTTYDTDAHVGNFLICGNSSDQTNPARLKKIDNGLSLPTSNRLLTNPLVEMIDLSPSADALARIKSLSIDGLAQTLIDLNLSDSVEPLKERIVFLKNLIRDNPSLTYKEINHHMQNIKIEENQ